MSAVCLLLSAPFYVVHCMLDDTLFSRSRSLRWQDKCTRNTEWQPCASPHC